MPFQENGKSYFIGRVPIMSAPKKFNAPVPFCFKSREAAIAAEAAVNSEFADLKAYATERTLFVPEHKSLLFRLGVEEFIKKLGGRRHSD